MIKYFTEKLDKRDKEFIDTVDLQKKEISDAFDYRLPMGLPPSDKLNRKEGKMPLGLYGRFNFSFD